MRKSLNYLKNKASGVASNRFLKAVLPKSSDFSFLFKGFIIFFVIFTFFQFFSYSSWKTRAADAEETGATVGTAAAGTISLVTQTFLSSLLECKNYAALAGSSGVENASQIIDYADCKEAALNPEKQTGLIQKNLGAVGRLLNTSTAMYETRIANPGLPSSYYANKVLGRAQAASPTSGNEILSPMYNFNRAMQNIAYGAVVIILVISALSSLLSYLGNGEQKITLIQLMLNTGLTLIFIASFYTLGAIVYDLTVNYGNSIVATTLEPYINAKIILERLQAGGDLNVTALLNVFEFAGVSQGLVTVANNVFYSIKPAITQSIDAFTSNIATELPLGAQTGALFSIGGGVVSYLISGVISSILGSQAIFDALIAFVIFSLNLKIFLNLLTAFLTFNIYMGIGPIMMLNGISGGFDKIKNVFKTLFAYGLVFPVTFLFILLGAIMMNFYVADNKDGTRKVDESLLCVYRTNDPVATEAELADRAILGRILGPNFNDDPSVFRRENTEFQDIYDVTPAFTTADDKRACRSSLFRTPFMALPAPLGNYGNRLLQAQTTDILMRTIIGIAFLILATRAPDLLKELLQVDELQSLKGLGGAFKAGFKPLLGAGSIGFGRGGAIVLGLGKLGTKIPFPVLGKLKGPLENLGRDLRNPKSNLASISDLYGKFKGGYAFDDAKGLYDKQVLGLTAQGMPLAQAQQLAVQNVAQNFAKLASSGQFLSSIFDNLIVSVTGLIKIFEQMGDKLSNFTALTSIDEV